MAEPWLSADDIAAHLGVTKDTVYAWIAEKHLPAHKLGRLWKFQTSEVDEWVRRGAAADGTAQPPETRGSDVSGSSYRGHDVQEARRRR